MADLRKRFGRLVAAHRRQCGLTQEALAEAARLSVDMVSKIEVGATGARFPVIERLAEALRVDPAELFTTELPTGTINRGTFADISSRLARLPQSDLLWVGNLIDAALKSKGGIAVESGAPSASDAGQKAHKPQDRRPPRSSKPKPRFR